MAIITEEVGPVLDLDAIAKNPVKLKDGRVLTTVEFINNYDSKTMIIEPPAVEGVPAGTIPRTASSIAGFSGIDGTMFGIIGGSILGAAALDMLQNYIMSLPYPGNYSVYVRGNYPVGQAWYYWIAPSWHNIYSI